MTQSEKYDVCDVRDPHPERIARAAAGMPEPGEIRAVADLFSLFGDPTRLRILTALAADELCVCDLSDALGMTSSAISHQLKLLRAARLVKSRRDGKAVFYSLDDDHVGTIVRMGIEHAAERK